MKLFNKKNLVDRYFSLVFFFRLPKLCYPGNIVHKKYIQRHLSIVCTSVTTAMYVRYRRNVYKKHLRFVSNKKIWQPIQDPSEAFNVM
jgi:hypothetical protein